MFDNSQRSMWLETAYTAMCKRFGFAEQRILIGASYPPAGARGDLSRVRPADFDRQWRGNDNEADGFLSIHPISFRSPNDCLKAMLWALGRTRGARHGAAGVGLHKEPDATITASDDTQAKLDAILAEVGNPPAGFAEPFPVRQTTRGRMVAYSCGCASAKQKGRGKLTIYSASSNVNAACGDCGQAFVKV
jgi:hypothetical protein